MIKPPGENKRTRGDHGITIIMEYGLVENMDMSNRFTEQMRGQFFWFKAFMV